MVLERAEIVIKQGMMEEFIAVFSAHALPLTAQFTGCHSFQALRGVEDADHIMFLAEWESIEAHLVSKSEPAHAKFREVVIPYVARPVGTVHFEPI